MDSKSIQPITEPPFPIPPSKYFTRSGDGAWHFLPAGLGNGSADVTKERVTWYVDVPFNGWMRGIIAAVAAEEWLDVGNSDNAEKCRAWGKDVR